MRRKHKRDSRETKAKVEHLKIDVPVIDSNVLLASKKFLVIIEKSRDGNGAVDRSRASAESHDGSGYTSAIRISTRYRERRLSAYAQISCDN
jgi:hypothetical protein